MESRNESSLVDYRKFRSSRVVYCCSCELEVEYRGSRSSRSPAEKDSKRSLFLFLDNCGHRVIDEYKEYLASPLSRERMIELGLLKRS